MPRTATTRTEHASGAGILQPVKPRAARAYDPAETFAHVASALRQEPPSRLELSRWRGRLEGKLDTGELAEAILESGVVTEQQVKVGVSDRYNAYILLRAIDQAFANLDPFTGVRHTGRLIRFRHNFRRLARYNINDEYGAVIPRRSFPARPQVVPDHEAEHFHSLLLVPRSTGKLRLRFLEPELDFPDTIRDEEHIKVGCVPFLAGTDELDVTRIDDVDSWYSIRARTSDESWAAHWQHRISTVIAELDQSGVHIGVLPELALTDEMLGWWQTELLGTERPPASRLEWILVGTGPITTDPTAEQQPNRAIMLHRDTGKQLLHQDKCEPFTISDQQIEDWQLRDALGTGSLSEWMHEGSERLVLETRGCRLAILVCEDHGRLLTVGAELATLAPTMLLVPIFAPPILRHRWQEIAGEQFAYTTGSASVITTGYAVRLRPEAIERDAKGRALPTGTAMALVPDQRGPSSSWSLDQKLKGNSGSPTEVVEILLPRS